MKTVIVLFSGLVLTIGFTSIFYFLQDHISSNEVAKKALKHERSVPIVKTNYPEPTEIKNKIEDTRHSIQEVETRSAAIENESVALENEATQLDEKKEVLEKSLSNDMAMIKVFSDQAEFPKEGPLRETLLKVASVIAGFGPNEGSKEPFAKVAAVNNQALIQVEVATLFGHLEPLALRSSMKAKLKTVMESLPVGTKMKRISIYQASDSHEAYSESRLRTLQEFLRKDYGAYVDEIQVRLTKKDSIPGHSGFLLEFSSEQNDADETGTPVNAEQPTKTDSGST